MWHKKKWVIIAVVAAVVILTIGILGGVAYAQPPTPSGTDSGKTLLGRVAAILGIEQQKVEEAFSQAQKDMQKDAQKARIEQMVNNGKITREQADKYQSWLDSRPDVPGNLDMGPGAGFKGRMDFKGFFPAPGGKMWNPGNFPCPSPSTNP